MYNIHSHYENIYHYLKSIIAHPRVLYLHPYGSTQPENIEVIAEDLTKVSGPCPLFIFYDQEPIYGEFNYRLFDRIEKMQGPKILVTTEKESQALNEIRARYRWPVVYYFHHIFAAHDWFRGYQYDSRLVEPIDRTLKKKFVSFNRLTSKSRVYRSLFVAELIKAGVLDQGHVSFNSECPEGGHYRDNLAWAVTQGLITNNQAAESTKLLDSLTKPLRIDYRDHAIIPNHSFVLSAVPETQESFCYVVTETCYWETKHHLTEKIFKPIVSKMPFILLGCQNNLAYLREYGFETFGEWWDESYDNIKDPVARLGAVIDVIKGIASRDTHSLESMLKEMNDVLQYNYNRFYSQDFLNSAWQELTQGLSSSVPI